MCTDIWTLLSLSIFAVHLTLCPRLCPQKNCQDLGPPNIKPPTWLRKACLHLEPWIHSPTKLKLPSLGFPSTRKPLHLLNDTLAHQQLPILWHEVMIAKTLDSSLFCLLQTSHSFCNIFWPLENVGACPYPESVSASEYHAVGAGARYSEAIVVGQH